MTEEKRCNDCNCEFYQCNIEEIENENGKFIVTECCPNCGSIDWEYKFVGKEK